MSEHEATGVSPYLSAEEVMELLGIKKSKFFDDVKKGLIPSELPEGKTRGHRFPREAIEIMARRQRKERAQQTAITYEFVPSTYSDIWNAVRNARRVYGPDDVISFERALEWRDMNPGISMSVRDGQHLAGMVTFLPLDEEIILTLARDRLRERDIPLESIRKWEDANLSVYIAGISIIATKDRAVNRRRGRFLIAHAIKWAITLTSQYDIRKWYAIGVTADGQNLLGHLGFHEIPIAGDLGDRLLVESQEQASHLQVPGEQDHEVQPEVERKAYSLDDFLTNQSKLVRHFLGKKSQETDE